MALEVNGRAPYTSASAAITTLQAFRDRSPSGPVTTDMLVKLGVPESISRRTLSSLQELGLVKDDGQPTEVLEAFKQTRGEDEYKTRLQEWLRDVYADVLPYGNPSEDSIDKIQEAFRGYEPEGQRKAMASLLIGLWEYAGLPLAEQPSSPTPRRTTPRPRQNTSPKPTRSTRRKSVTTHDDLGDLSPALVGLLKEMQQLGGRWTAEQRDTFHRAFATLTDLTMRIVQDNDDEDSEVLDEQEVSA